LALLRGDSNANEFSNLRVAPAVDNVKAGQAPSYPGCRTRGQLEMLTAIRGSGLMRNKEHGDTCSLGERPKTSHGVT